MDAIPVFLPHIVLGFADGVAVGAQTGSGVRSRVTAEMEQGTRVDAVVVVGEAVAEWLAASFRQRHGCRSRLKPIISSSACPDGVPPVRLKRLGAPAR